MDALSVYEEGIAHFNAGRFAKAAEAFRAQARLKDDPEPRCFLGHALAALGRREAARRELAAAARRWPGYAPAWLGLAQLWREDGKLAKARGVLERALENGADEKLKNALCELVRAQALAAKDARRDAEAAAYWRELEALAADPSEARKELAAALRRKDAGRGPKRAARASPAANPRDPMRLVQALVRTLPPRVVLARFDAEIAAAKGLDALRWRVHRGEVHLWLGDYAKGLADISAGAERPEFRWPPVGRGAALLMLGRLDEAEASLARGVQTAPPEAWRPWRGELRRRKGDLAGALEDLTPCLDQPYRAGAWLNAALVWLAQGKAGKARDAARALWDIHPALFRAAGEAAGLGGDAPVERVSAPELERFLSSALTLLRGNRSNWLRTWSPDGRALIVLE